MEQVKKTAKWYRDQLAKCDVRTALNLIPEIIKKFGFVTKYRSEINFPRKVVSDNFNWNHSIEGFDLSKVGQLYAKVYWQGDSTDGTEYVPARYLIGGYTIKAEWDNVGGSWGMRCRHSPLEVTEEELRKAIKAIIPLLATDLIRARKKTQENEPFVMPMYGRINRFLEREHPFNRWGTDTYTEKWHNAEGAIRELAIPDAKKYMKMTERECESILDKVFEQNFKTNAEFTKDDKGNKVYNLAI
jgi:hypothetical protein